MQITDIISSYGFIPHNENDGWYFINRNFTKGINTQLLLIHIAEFNLVTIQIRSGDAILNLCKEYRYKTEDQFRFLIENNVPGYAFIKKASKEKFIE